MGNRSRFGLILLGIAMAQANSTVFLRKGIMNITMTREALLDRLNDRLALAKKEDDKVIAEHKVAEQKCLGRFRELLKGAAKWDYPTLKRKYFQVRCEDTPSCPQSEAERIKRVISSVTLDTRKAAFRISPGSDLSSAVNWLPRNERPKESMC
jgi:hypothetical protein